MEIKVEKTHPLINQTCFAVKSVFFRLDRDGWRPAVLGRDGLAICVSEKGREMR